MTKLKILLFFVGALGLSFFTYNNIQKIKNQEVRPITILTAPKTSTKELVTKEEIKPAQISNPAPIRSKIEARESFLTASGTIAWTNIERSIRGLPSLILDPQLERAARTKALDMFEKQYFEHISPTGASAGDLATKENYGFIYIGENLALGNFENDRDLVAAWIASPGHKANIINPKYKNIGVATLRGVFEGRTTWIAVQIFGLSQLACPKPNDNKEKQISLYENELNKLEDNLTELKEELNSTDPKTKEEVSAYNTRVEKYNDLIRQYNDLLTTIKLLLGEYNDEVRSYNTCLQST